jgi:hypothetical protein
MNKQRTARGNANIRIVSERVFWISATTQPIELIFCRYFPCMLKILVDALELQILIYFDLFPKSAKSLENLVEGVLIH